MQLFNQSDPGTANISTGEYTVIIFSRVFHMLTGFGLSINGRHNYCGDYLYSGHTVILTIGNVARPLINAHECNHLSRGLANLSIVAPANPDCCRCQVT